MLRERNDILQACDRLAQLQGSAVVACTQPQLAFLGVAMRACKAHPWRMTTRQTPSSSSPLHVIAGAGQIGPMIAERLVARGFRVRMIRRGAFSNAPAGVETV